jgi:MOSC domain-containing protein YiiM
MSTILNNKKETVGKVLALFISKKGNSSREKKEKLYLDMGGVMDDKFYEKDIDRSVLISSLKSYDIAKKHNIELEYGVLGENIVVDYNLYTLAVGTKLKIGEALLEISQNCTLCKSLTKVDNKLPKILKNDRGVFTRVIKPGYISQNDSITILS